MDMTKHNDRKYQLILETGTIDADESYVINRLMSLSNLAGVDYQSVSDLVDIVCDNIADVNTPTMIDDVIVSIATEKTVESEDYCKIAMRIIMSRLHSHTHDDYLDTVECLNNYIGPDGKESPMFNDGFVAFVRQHRTTINNAFHYERDYDYDIFSYRTLEKSYLKRTKDGVIMERPQHLIMRVAISLHGHSGGIDRVLECYENMSCKYYTHATPTLFNAGTRIEQLSSCFLLTVDDDMENIGDIWKDCAMISKYGGGISVNVCNIRSNGAYIASTGGKSSGLRMLHVLNEVANYADQGGKRAGSIAVFIEPWHADVEYFLSLKTRTGAATEKSRDLFLGLSVNDIFMKRAENDEMWSLMCPYDCPDLRGKYGEEFEEIYLKYEREGNYVRQIRARELLLQIQKVMIETGVPYITFKDAINKKSNVINIGVVESLNLCVEVTLPSCSQYYSVCFTEDARVLTDRGEKKITQCHNINVYSHYDNDKDLRVSPHYEAASLIKNGVKMAFSLGTRGNRPVSVTADHPMLVLENGDYIWKTVRDLRLGDRIVTPHIDTLDNFKISRSEHDINAMAKGWMSSNKWSQTTSLDQYNDNYIFDDMQHRVDNVTDDLIQRVFNGPSETTKSKSVPHDIMHGAPVSQANYLSALYSLDGAVKMRKNRLSIHLATTSLNFAYDVQSMLVPFGIKSHVMTRGKNEPIYVVTCRDTTSVHRFQLYIGFRLSLSKTLHTEELVAKSVKRKCRRYAVIDKLNAVGYHNVYDLLVPVGHNYVVNGHVVHNCNLASISLPKFVENGTFNYHKLHEITRTVTRNLNNIIDINFYPVEKTKHYNKSNRPIGIGQQGLADVFALLQTSFDSEYARDVNRKIAETIYHAALTESCVIAKETKPYASFEGSPISQGKFQFDLWDLDYSKLSGMWDWESLRNNIMTYGVANCLTTTCMPTASTSQIMGNNECIEPYTENIYVRSTMAGEYYIVNRHLRRELVELGLWNREMIDLIKYTRGSIARIKSIPDDIKHRYRTVWEISQKSLIEMSADRGPFIDNSQSLNIFIAQPSYMKLNSCMFKGWKLGLKTGVYYLRSKPNNIACQFGIDELTKKYFDDNLLEPEPEPIKTTNKTTTNKTTTKHTKTSTPPAAVCRWRPSSARGDEPCSLCEG